jgi:hypothetical protein
LSAFPTSVTKMIGVTKMIASGAFGAGLEGRNESAPPLHFRCSKDTRGQRPSYRG